MKPEEFTKLTHAIAEILEISPDAVHMESSFASDLDADSFDMAKITMVAEEIFHISIPSEDVIHILTVKDLASYAAN